MNYLFWSSIDLEKGMGGVEVHARSLAHELRRQNIQVTFSQDPLMPWLRNWDVVHTHGSSLYGFKALFKRSDLPVSTVWVHTLHGWTHERMAACNEYFWPGAYAAIFNEYVGSRNADHVFAIHEGLGFLHKLKSYSICGNGWDSWGMEKIQNIGLLDCEDSWLYIGRGSDPVKGVDRLLPFTKQIKLAAIPGEGFEDSESVKKMGIKNHTEIRAALSKSKGLILASRHEGLPLVVLEALALGVPVITTRVGGLKTLSENLKAIYYCKDDLSDLVPLTLMADRNDQNRENIALNNQKYLKKWSEVAGHVLKTIEQIRVKKGFVHVH